MLTELGATAAEDRVYGLLVTAVSACEHEIAGATGLSPDDVRIALASLIERGLAERMPETPSRFVAASPSVVESMISERLSRVANGAADTRPASSQYRANSLARTADGVFEIIRGEDALRDCSLSLLRSARSEVLNLIKPPLIAVQPEEQIGPGDSVRNRIIYETCALKQPGMIDALRTGLLARDEARVHPELPIKMLAVDQSGRRSFRSRSTTPRRSESWCARAPCSTRCCALFEHVWATAIPLHVQGMSNGQPPAVVGSLRRGRASSCLCCSPASATRRSPCTAG